MSESEQSAEKTQQFAGPGPEPGLEMNHSAEEVFPDDE